MPQLRGPHGLIEYQRDDLGFPSIDAKSFEEASWARGWFHAHDRLVQVQLTLAIASGRALELIGDKPFARYVDRMTRLYRFTDDLDEEAARLTPATRRSVDAYCEGFNAGAKARGWPLLLRAAGIGPRPYRAQEMLLMYRIVAWFGLNQLIEMATLITSELVASNASPRALGLLLGDSTSAEEIASAPIAQWPEELSGFAAVGAASKGMGGSNAIAIAGTRSASGGALVAADPHLEIARIPPVLYAMHASHGDGRYMQGLHVPGFMFASFGRTERTAWTYTYGRLASVDVRVVRCRNGEMFDGTQWRPLSKRTTTVKVKKRPSETWTFWECALGTIAGDAQREAEIQLPCVVWSGVREFSSDLNSVEALLNASTVDEVIAASLTWSGFCLDAIVADTHGRIAHAFIGRMNARASSSGGVTPRAPSEPELRCQDDTTRPMTIDPPSGWIVSANTRPIESGGRTWVPMPDTPARYQRLATLVDQAGDNIGLADLASFLLDACDACAMRLVAAWAPHLPDHPRANKLVEWAAAQTGHGDDHFVQLTLWNALHLRVCRVLLRKHLGPRGDALLDELAGLQLFRYHLDEALALERPHHLDAAELKEVLAEAFPLAVIDAAAPAVQLPRRHRFKNAVFQGKFGFLLDSRPVENRGGPTTPNQVTVQLVDGHPVVFGGAGRYLCDMSSPGGWYSMSGGASERRFGIGYGAGLEDWARGRFRPLGSPTGTAPRVR